MGVSYGAGCPACGAVFCYCDQEDAKVRSSTAVTYPGAGDRIAICTGDGIRYGVVGADCNIELEPRWPWLRRELARALELQRG